MQELLAVLVGGGCSVPSVVALRVALGCARWPDEARFRAGVALLVGCGYATESGGFLYLPSRRFDRAVAESVLRIATS